MTLREQIARVLAGIKWPSVLTSDESVSDMEVDAAQGRSATWGDMADECIRQMQWARYNIVKIMPHEGEPGAYDVYHHPMTAAPEGWKP